MKFAIESIIIWPKNKQFDKRIINFSIDKINVLYGLSRTGKSAIIPIIDYCLASEKCMIPVDIIREKVDWYGVVIDTDNKKILLCRREPGPSNENIKRMHYEISDNIIIPNDVTENANREQVKEIINTLLGFSTERISENDNNYSGRPSIRDAVSLLFQPQNIIANQNTMFYKTDKTEHRKRLTRLFPYFLRYETYEMIRLKNSLENIRIELKRKEKELKSIIDVSDNWKAEIDACLLKAQELGLINETMNCLDFKQKISLLRNISSESDAERERVFDANNKLSNYISEEKKLSMELGLLTKRRTTILQLQKDASLYKDSLEIQKNRLNISKFIKDLTESSNSHYKNLFTNQQIEDLCNALYFIENKYDYLNDNKGVFDKELVEIEKSISEITGRLKYLRTIIKQSDTNYFSNSDKSYFLGQLSAKIETFDAVNSDGELNDEVLKLRDKVGKLQSKLNSLQSINNEQLALNTISDYIGKYLKTLDVEKPDSKVVLDIEELTIKVANSNNNFDYLWEIGSASNWVSYHMSTLLSLQEFLQSDSTSPIPNFLIFDQPSQVYFPSGEFEDGKDEDKKAVKKMFETMDLFMKNNNNNCQIIVLEHAGLDIWGNVENVHPIDKFDNDNKLIPKEW